MTTTTSTFHVMNAARYSNILLTPFSCVCVLHCLNGIDRSFYGRLDNILLICEDQLEC